MEEYTVEFATTFVVNAKSEDEAKKIAKDKFKKYLRENKEDSIDIFESYVN